MKTQIVGQIGAYRELSHKERVQKMIQGLAAARKVRLAKELGSLPALWNDALGHIVDAICRLEQIDKQYDKRYPDDDCERLELDFWGQVLEAIEPLRRISQGLEAVEKHMPKEPARDNEVVAQLVTAIGRHPAAEADPDIVDAINRIEDALQGEAIDASTTK